jgi:hypothetical protein
VKIYHRTFHVAAILTRGFRDHAGTYMTRSIHKGVWFSAPSPLDLNEGADGDVVLALDIPEDQLLRYEWIEEGKGYREFLIPAKLANQYGPPEVCEEDFAG